MNAQQIETLGYVIALTLLGYAIWRMRGKRWTPFSEGSIDARSTRTMRQDERLDAYALRFQREDESRLRRVALGIDAHKRIVERTKQIPKHRALVVIQQVAKPNNVVHLPTGQPVQVTVRRPKLSMVR